MSYATHAACIKAVQNVQLLLLFYYFMDDGGEKWEQKKFLFPPMQIHTQVSCIIFIYLFSKLKTVLNREWLLSLSRSYVRTHFNDCNCAV